jgi:hypothetical protein
MQFVGQKLSMAAKLLITPKLPPLHMGTLRIQREISDDVWNKFPIGSINCSVFDKQQKDDEKEIFVGEFNYRIHTGQVGGIFIANGYRYQALEQQMLIYMMKDMQDVGAKRIWEVVPDETNTSYNFYSKLWSFQFKKSHVHSSVTGGGYIMDIPKDLRTLPIMRGIGVYERDENTM